MGKKRKDERTGGLLLMCSSDFQEIKGMLKVKQTGDNFSGIDLFITGIESIFGEEATGMIGKA